MYIYFLALIHIIIFIFAYIYLYRVYNETKTDPFQYALGFEEKKKFFNYTINYERYMNGFDYNCKVYQDLILEPETKKLGDVFNIKTETIHYCSVILLFTTFILFSFVFLYLAIIPCLLICTPLVPFLMSIIAGSGIITPFIGWVNIITIIVSIYSFNKCDINAYYDFLTCENINYDAFEKYRNIESLKTDFKNFMILIIINMISGCIYGCLDAHNASNARNSLGIN